MLRGAPGWRGAGARRGTGSCRRIAPSTRSAPGSTSTSGTARCSSGPACCPTPTPPSSPSRRRRLRRRRTCGSCSRGCRSGTPRPRAWRWTGSSTRSTGTRRASCRCSAAPTCPRWCSCSWRRRPSAGDSRHGDMPARVEGALPPLIRLAESGSSLVGREKAVLMVVVVTTAPCLTTAPSSASWTHGQPA
ncbi:hypothetical protein VPH35_100877 [Triticum aestivum]